MTDRDARVRAIPETEGTKPAGDLPSPTARPEVPADEDGVEATGGVRGGHSHAPNPQAEVELDPGVAREHLTSTSQGARPEPDAPDAPDAPPEG